MLSNRQLLHEQVRLADQLHAVCHAIETMKAIELDVRQRLTEAEAEWKRRSHGKVGPIAERDDTEIVITDESNLDEVVRRAEAGELAMRVDVVDIDGETA